MDLNVNSDYLTTILNGLAASKKRRESFQESAQNLLNSSLPSTGPTGMDAANGMSRLSNPSGSVADWIQQAGKALGRNWSPAELKAISTMIQKESGGNPNAINKWDSNAKKGTPSQGLMQTIPGTFKQYAMPGYNSNILDPISNIIAGVRYAESRYGNLGNVPGIKAMNSGGAYRGY